MSLVTGPIFQICWVVEDLDAAERHFTDQFGVARWLRLPNVHFGPGVHHVAWVPDDFEATLAEAASRGLPIVQQGRFEGVGMEFAYLDGGPLGSYVELMKLSEEMRAMFDSLVPE